VPAPPFTVVVCTRDRTDSLARCLASLRDLEYDAFEIVVVDNAPTSARTAELVATTSARMRAPRTLRYVREDRPGLDWARNRGIAEAAHELIAFTDDDVRVDAGWLTGLATAFSDPSVMMATGLVAPAELDTDAQVEFEDGYGGMGKGFLPRRWQRDSLVDTELLGAHHLGVGANMAFRRELLRRVGGFDTALDVGTPSHGAGDLEMFHRVLVSGAVAHYEPGALVWHAHRRDRAGLARQLRDNGRAFGVYLIGCAMRRTVPVMRVVRYAAIIWLGWLVGRLARSLVGRDRLPAALRAAELWGAMQAPWAYWRTRRSDRALRRGMPDV
jgi:glycosyltransferase involved in cell wall biosynthesis